VKVLTDDNSNGYHFAIFSLVEYMLQRAMMVDEKGEVACERMVVFR